MGSVHLMLLVFVVLAFGCGDSKMAGGRGDTVTVISRSNFAGGNRHVFNAPTGSARVAYGVEEATLTVLVPAGASYMLGKETVESEYSQPQRVMFPLSEVIRLQCKGCR